MSKIRKDRKFPLEYWGNVAAFSIPSSLNGGEVTAHRLRF